jgi:GNAT superfamily N-acetyltransferase
MREIIPITPEAVGYEELLEESAAEGHRMLVRLAGNWQSGRNRFARPGEMLMGAFRDGKLAGVCGLSIDPYFDDPRAGRVRHLYVSQSSRKLGIGRNLVRCILEGAAISFDYLNVRAPREAFGFYERLGFVPVEDEETVTHRLSLSSCPRIS